jgi:hypothetical protein
MKPDCIHCSGHLRLSSNHVSNYSWQCEGGCSELADTGISTVFSIVSFQSYALPKGELDISKVICPIKPEYIPGARVYMPQIFYHFIECTWGGCYNHLYLNCIAPLLDAPEVVDYVLRSPVIHPSSDIMRGSTGALIYDELYYRLSGVRSAKIADYLRNTFEQFR